MFPEQPAIGTEDQRGAIQGSAVALDHADHQVQAVVPGDVADERDGRSRDFNRVVKEPAKLLPPLRRANPHADTEVVPLGITADERLGKDREFRPPSCRLAGQRGKFAQRPRRVKHARRRLNDRRPDRVGTG